MENCMDFQMAGQAGTPMGAKGDEPGNPIPGFVGQKQPTEPTMDPPQQPSTGSQNPGGSQSMGQSAGMAGGHYTHPMGSHYPHPGQHDFAAWNAWWQAMAQQAAINPAMTPHFWQYYQSQYPKHEQHRYGQVIDTVSRIVNGQADMGDMVTGLFNINFHDDQFWKGLIVGAVTTLLLKSETVKSVFRKKEAEEEGKKQ
ncbi:MAG: hypothetical protein QMC83_05060 [Thermodesulfovibrionales bacterium]|nr:hypothetical protein [Thermodesulfovibrionales bacterium]